MMDLIGWLFTEKQPAAFDAAFGVPRHPDWQRVSAAFKVGKACAFCGGLTDLEVHHIRPFHQFPELEMAEGNWIVLCGDGGRGCHFLAGHLGNWQRWNSEIAKICRIMNGQRRMREVTL